jgi:hypothetical protein
MILEPRNENVSGAVAEGIGNEHKWNLPACLELTHGFSWSDRKSECVHGPRLSHFANRLVPRREIKALDGRRRRMQLTELAHQWSVEELRGLRDDLLAKKGLQHPFGGMDMSTSIPTDIQDHPAGGHPAQQSAEFRCKSLRITRSK